MTTKADRQRDYERRMKDRAQWTDGEWELLRMAYSAGYDEGFADGVVRGQNYQAQITDMVMGAMSPPIDEAVLRQAMESTKHLDDVREEA